MPSVVRDGLGPAFAGRYLIVPLCYHGHTGSMKSRGKPAKAGKKSTSSSLASPKSHERNLATMYALVAYDPFQNEVSKIRADLRIGSNATLADTKQNWIVWAEEETERVMDSKAFQLELRRITQERQA